MALPCSSDIGELGVVAELGGAQREACVGGWRGHVWLWREGGLELVGVGGIARLVMWEDGWGGEDPVRVWSWVPGVSWVVGVRADAQGHLVNYSACLRVREAVAVLEERGRRRARGQDGMGVVGSGEGAARSVGQQGVRGQALGVCVLGG